MTKLSETKVRVKKHSSSLIDMIKGIVESVQSTKRRFRHETFNTSSRSAFLKDGLDVIDKEQGGLKYSTGYLATIVDSRGISLDRRDNLLSISVPNFMSKLEEYCPSHYFYNNEIGLLGFHISFNFKKECDLNAALINGIILKLLLESDVPYDSISISLNKWKNLIDDPKFQEHEVLMFNIYKIQYFPGLKFEVALQMNRLLVDVSDNKYYIWKNECYSWTDVPRSPQPLEFIPEISKEVGDHCRGIINNIDLSIDEFNDEIDWDYPDH